MIRKTKIIYYRFVNINLYLLFIILHMNLKLNPRLLNLKFSIKLPTSIITCKNSCSLNLFAFSGASFLDIPYTAKLSRGKTFAVF